MKACEPEFKPVCQCRDCRKEAARESDLLFARLIQSFVSKPSAVIQKNWRHRDELRRRSY